MKREDEYVMASTSFTKGPRGSGWSLNLLDKDNNGFGVNVNYHKVGSPNQTLFKEEINIHDLKRIRDFCDTAIKALCSKTVSKNDL